jgi:hypothetical protein
MEGQCLPTGTSPCCETVFLSLWTKQPVRSADGLREKHEQSGRNSPAANLLLFFGTTGFSGENYRTERDLRRGTTIANQASRLPTFPVSRTSEECLYNTMLPAGRHRTAKARARLVPGSEARLARLLTRARPEYDRATRPTPTGPQVGNRVQGGACCVPAGGKEQSRLSLPFNAASSGLGHTGAWEGQLGNARPCCPAADRSGSRAGSPESAGDLQHQAKRVA